MLDFSSPQLFNLIRYMNRDYKIIIPCKYQSASDFSEGLAAVKKDGHWMSIDTKGRVVLSFKKPK